MSEAPIASGFERDPDLDPIQPPPAAAPATPAPTRRAGPKVEPAEPRLWQTTIPLRFPLLVDGELLAELTIHRLTGQEVAELVLEDDDATSLNARARAHMARVHPDVIAALSGDDAEAFTVACRPLFSAALAALEAQVRADIAAAI